MWALLYLPTADIVYCNEIKDFVEIVFDQYFFYKDSVTGEIRRFADRRDNQLISITYKDHNGTLMQCPVAHIAIPLQRCEFEVMEVEYGSKAATLTTGSGDNYTDERCI